MKTATDTHGQFVIACNKRDDPRVTLFMLDRNKVRHGSNFWTEILDHNVLRVRVRHVADGIAGKLKFQNPRVLTAAEAQLAFDTNNELRGRDDDVDPEGAGWDAHKDWL
ncbi:hypothetical protein PJWF_00087 [Achromobacter phage JWF]|uniref:hypothetical protein n=1 Tax=Achromobacter phage JWF TaxID=1589748 RepID=UPI000588E42F|nr:hypothetical protein AXJ13_gp101 [Achromobacter phage JWF]AJD82980.1 hypothetical protein PJWF_00087 [Achromobacter phage JWF]